MELSDTFYFQVALKTFDQEAAAYLTEEYERELNVLGRLQHCNIACLKVRCI